MLDSCDGVINKCRHDSGDDMIKMEAIVTMEVEVDVIVVAATVVMVVKLEVVMVIATIKAEIIN